MPKEYFYLKEHFVTAIRNNHIHPKIPQIIHQIYEDLAGPPPSLVEISQSWKELNPDWEYRFWNKNSKKEGAAPPAGKRPLGENLFVRL